MIRVIITVVLVIMVAGCDMFSDKTIASICKDYPPMCNDLNSDGRCRYERAEVIRQRHEHLQSPTPENKYDLLLFLEDYEVCIEKASGIEHIKYKDKKSGRIEGLNAARRQLRQLARDTKDMDHPDLLHYHWSRFGDEGALERFLALDAQGKLETPQYKIYLAEHFVKFDLERTVETLFRALELYNSGDEVDPEIFYSLSTIYLKLEKFPKAYLWGYVAKEYDVEELDLTQIEALVRQVGKNPGRIENIADDYISAIRSGSFKSPRV